MGGKKRQAQRTKNNAMPSNSGRSAEYLSSNIPHFSGFSGMKETGLIFPLMATEDIELCIDANYQLVFKKMNKKDSTTKIKALQEFADLVKNSDAEEVKAVLPCWPRLYNTLATDSEHKVREATHVAHNEVVQKVKRNLAPHLKSLIAAWFTSQYDTYPPAATAAALSFKNAFPEKKVEEVIVFCNKEILEYIYDNLFVQTPQTVGNPKQSTPEELVAKHERVLISSLNGYSLYLKKIPKEKIVESSELNRKIINNNKFWKYSRHNLMIVRAAWFEVLTALFEKAPFLLEQEEGHVVSYTLGSIDEADPILLPLVWQNVLLVTSMKDWHTKVNIDKLMLPKLWKILKDGGNGNASTIFPNLLPLLSNMMEIVDVNTFYYNFFRNLCASLKAKSVVASRSESTAISTSFIECIRYVIMKHESNVELCEKIIKYYLISSIHWCVTETQSCYKTIFNQTASLVQYWSRNNVKEESNYFRYLTYFWNNINSLFEGVLMDLEISNSEKMSQLAETQVEFLKTMKHMAKVKKCLKVKFNVSNETIPTIHETSPSNQLNEFYLNGLQDTVLRLCEIYVKLISGKNSKELMDHLAALIDEFDSTNFFNLLSKKMTGDQHSDVIILFEKLLKNWLDCENLLCKSLIHIVFSTFKHLGDEGKQIVLDNLNKISNAECVGWCLEEALSHQYNKDILIRKWLMNDKVTNFLVDIVEKKVSACCPANFCVLLKIAITENAEEELYVSQEAISKILEKLKEPLLNPNDHLQSIDACLSLAANLSAVIYTKNYLLTFTDDLLLSLLRLSCDTSINKDYLSSDTTWEVQTAWQDALTLLSSSLSKNELEPTMGKVVSFFHKSLETENLGEDKLQRLITALINVSRAIYKSTPFQINDILNDIFNHTIILNQRKLITDICKWAEYSNGNLASCYEEFEVASDVKVDCQELLQFFTWLYVRVKVLTAKVCDTVDDDEEDDDEEIGDIWSFLDVKMNWIIQILYDLELGKCFLLNFETVKSSIEIEKFVKKAVSIYISSMKRFSKDDVNSLWLTLRAQARSSCWIWIRAIYTSQICLLSEDPIKIYEDLLKDVTTDDKLAVVQSTQVFSKHLNYDYVACSFDSVSRIVILRCLSRNKEIDVQIAEVMSTLELLRNDTEKFSWENFKLDWQPYQIILETCRLFNELIKYQFDSLSSKQIDLIVISLTEWLQRVVQLNKIEKVKPMLIAITNLYQTINYKINELREPEKIIPLVKEWDDLFAEGAQTDLVNLWLGYAGHFKGIQNALPVRELPVMYSFTSMTNCFNHKLIFRQSEDMPSRRSRLLKESCELLTSNLSTLQLAGYKTLLSLIPGLVDIDTEAVDTNTPNKDGLIFEMFKGICLSTQEIVSTMLLDFKLGEDSCRVEPFTDSYNYTLAYLLIWDVMLCLCEKASMELKFQYADWLRQEDILKNLLDNLFRLMPIEIFQHADSKNLYHAEWFSSRVEFQEKICTSADLEHMVCWIYYSALSQLPALVRLWWTGVETRIAQIVEKITSVYVSPLLCSRELKVISQHEKKFKNMTVKVLPTVREVVAVYTVDESQMELIITLPTNYPLGGPEVQCNRQIGGSTKQWLMQFKKCVLHQNGRIWDGLSLWNNSLDKKFDGVEECYICFAVLHPGTYQLPKLSCQTCRKKFHAPCLYKWFSTSNKSSCPICRNLF